MTEQSRTQDEAAVLTVLRGVSQAWSKGDADAFVAEFLEDASAIIPGLYQQSREEIRKAMSFSFGGPLKGTTTTDKVLDVRFLSDEAAVVVTESGVLIPGEAVAPPERTALATWVLAKRDGSWLMSAYQSSPVTANLG